MTEEVAETALVVTVKVAVVAPANTVTLLPTCAAPVLLLERVTTEPPVGAAAFSVTVPVELVLPVTLVGLSDTEETAGGLTVRVEVFATPNVAVTVTAVELETALVVTVNVAVFAPANTVTLTGTCAAPVLLLDSVTTEPPVGAAPLNTTVAVELLFPVMLVGLRVSELRVGGLTVSVALWATP